MNEQTLVNYIHVYEGTKPVLLEMPHSGLSGLNPGDKLPLPFVSKLNSNSENFKKAIGIGCDSCVPEMTGFKNLINELGFFGISNDLARILCDTNRYEQEVSGWVVAGAEPEEHHHGVIWSSIPHTDINLHLSDKKLKEMVLSSERIFTSPLTRGHFNIFMNEIYRPYHSHLQMFHQKAIRRYGFSIHIALHSMPPFTFALNKICGAYVFGKKAKRGPLDPENGTLPDIILIHNNYEAANKNIVDCLRYSFRSAGLIVADGQGPFIGNNGVTKIYGDPKKGINVIGIEHVAHDLEPERHIGIPTVNTEEAQKLREIYRQTMIKISNFTDF